MSEEKSVSEEKGVSGEALGDAQAWTFKTMNTLDTSIEHTIHQMRRDLTRRMVYTVKKQRKLEAIADKINEWPEEARRAFASYPEIFLEGDGE